MTSVFRSRDLPTFEGGCGRTFEANRVRSGVSAGERGGNTLNEFRPENSSSQDQNLA